MYKLSLRRQETDSEVEVLTGNLSAIGQFLAMVEDARVNTAPGLEVVLSRKEEKPKEARTRPKKEVDWGKFDSLKNAGWNFERIADDLGMSPTTLRKRMEERESGDE